LPGEKELVPVNKRKVPESMPTMYDEAYIKQSEQQQKILYGKEHDTLVLIR